MSTSTLERLTIRIESDAVDHLDQIVHEERRFQNRSDAIRTAINEFIETRAKYATRVVADIPSKDLADLRAMVQTGVVNSIAEALRIAVAHWLDEKTAALKQRSRILRDLKHEEFDARVNDRGW